MELQTDNTAQEKSAFLDALRSTLGIITLACEKSGVRPSDVKKWRKADAEFASSVEEIMDMQCDFVEGSLLRLIKEGDTAATIFYLKTKGKKRGYSEKALQEPKKEISPEAAAVAAKEAKKKVRAKKDYIIRLLKKEGKYTSELSMQVTLTAQLMVRAEQLQAEMGSPDYQQVIVEYSREGNRRESVNPKEKLLIDLSGQIQKALRALGMNTDSKERKTDGDDLGDFMKALDVKEDTP